MAGKVVLPDESSCGIRRNYEQNRIYQGDEVRSGEYPWVAVVTLKIKANGSVLSTFSCGGVILNNKYVLTAAHCAYAGGDPVIGYV